ncbi:hypothetical protein [Sulfuracidifex metallicus]|nr:hypothetical protein [Sulfuracidifex metallicus]
MASVLVGPSHMFLDMFTEAGVYVKKGGKWRRYALAHFRYNNPLVNGLAALAGVFFIASYIFLFILDLLYNLTITVELFYELL